MPAVLESPTKTETSAPDTAHKADIPGITRPMTYEEYLAGPEEMARYDIIDGYKIYRTWGENKVPNPTRLHQRLVLRLSIVFAQWAQATRGGECITAPCDVRVAQNPTRTRQPDVLFISSERLAQNPPPSDPSPLAPAPELVVEILSPSDTRRVLTDKLADYARVNVQECWIIGQNSETVEVVSLDASGVVSTVAVYGHGQTVESVVFPGLTASVDALFADE